MKVRSFVAAALVAALCASAAVAAPPPDKGKPATNPSGHQPGKPPTQGPGCRPQVTVVLKGTIAAVSSTQLDMNVIQSNRWGRVYKTVGTASVTLTTDTKVRRNGKKMLTDLAMHDWVLVQARVCKADLANGAPLAPLTAVRVVAHPAKA
jgi:hypothetical protein